MPADLHGAGCLPPPPQPRGTRPCERRIWSRRALSLFLVSTLLRKGKPSVADMAKAALAGGVAVGATCNLVRPAGAFAVGLLPGSLWVVGYALIQPRLERRRRSSTPACTTRTACRACSAVLQRRWWHLGLPRLSSDEFLTGPPAEVPTASMMTDLLALPRRLHSPQRNTVGRGETPSLLPPILYEPTVDRNASKKCVAQEQ